MTHHIFYEFGLLIFCDKSKVSIIENIQILIEISIDF